MLVKILRDGKYSDFSAPPKVGVQVLEAVVEVDFPLWYATSLVESGMAEEVAVEEPEAEVKSPAKKPSRRKVRKMGDAREISGLTGDEGD